MPLSPYGVSKVHAERHVLGGPQSIEHVILRYGNVYGPGQHPDGNNGVGAIFTQQLLEGQTTQPLGAGDCPGARPPRVWVGEPGGPACMPASELLPMKRKDRTAAGA